MVSGAAHGVSGWVLGAWVLWGCAAAGGFSLRASAAAPGVLHGRPPDSSPAPTPVTAVLGPGDAIGDASVASPEELARMRLPGASVLLATPWPGGGGFDDVVAAVVHRSRGAPGSGV